MKIDMKEHPGGAWPIFELYTWFDDTDELLKILSRKGVLEVLSREVVEVIAPYHGFKPEWLVAVNPKFVRLLGYPATDYEPAEIVSADLNVPWLRRRVNFTRISTPSWDTTALTAGLGDDNRLKVASEDEFWLEAAVRGCLYFPSGSPADVRESA